MQEKKDRIILDTNLWISFLLTKDHVKLDGIIKDKGLVILFSKELLDEFIEVAGRSKFKRYFSLKDLNEFIHQLSSRAEFVIVTSEIKICRDPKDDFLLSLAIDGKATHLITGDKDLLDLQKFESTAIVTIIAYLSGK